MTRKYSPTYPSCCISRLPVIPMIIGLFLLCYLSFSQLASYPPAVPAHTETQSKALAASDHGVSKVKSDLIDVKVAKFRKKFKQVSDSGINIQAFVKRINIVHNVPYSIPGYEKPHFSSGLHTFLYRLTYF